MIGLNLTRVNNPNLFQLMDLILIIDRSITCWILYISVLQYGTHQVFILKTLGYLPLTGEGCKILQNGIVTKRFNLR